MKTKGDPLDGWRQLESFSSVRPTDLSAASSVFRIIIICLPVGMPWKLFFH